MSCSSIPQEIIQEENKTFGDILQGSFLDHYRNLTRKNLMGLDWASSRCKNATFILKVDDDVIFNLYETYAILCKWNINFTEKDSFLLGYVVKNGRPDRSARSKSYISPMKYIHNYYTSYLSGWYYITTPETAHRIAKQAVHHAFFPIDDVFITGKLKNSLNITLKELDPQYYSINAYKCFKYMTKKFVIPIHPVVGQNVGRGNLIVEFYKFLQDCNIWRNCTSGFICR